MLFFRTLTDQVMICRNGRSSQFRCTILMTFLLWDFGTATLLHCTLSAVKQLQGNIGVLNVHLPMKGPCWHRLLFAARPFASLQTAGRVPPTRVTLSYARLSLTLLCRGIRAAKSASPTRAEGPICRMRSIAQTMIWIGAVLKKRLSASNKLTLVAYICLTRERVSCKQGELA